MTPKQKNTKPEAKQRILAIAEEIFAAKGYHGASVDEIAKRARVPKSLIYYHFKGKEELLKVLFDRFIAGFQEILRTYDDHQEFQSEPTRSRVILNIFLDYIEAQRDTLKILLMESLKSSAYESYLFQIADLIVAEHTKGQTHDASNTDTNDHLKQLFITEFFTSILPLANFAVYHEKLEQYLDITHEELDSRFITSYDATHGAYHRHLER